MGQSRLYGFGFFKKTMKSSYEHSRMLDASGHQISARNIQSFWMRSATNTCTHRQTVVLLLSIIEIIYDNSVCMQIHRKVYLLLRKDLTRTEIPLNQIIISAQFLYIKTFPRVRVQEVYRSPSLGQNFPMTLTCF